jgi:hypothetical protein
MMPASRSLLRSASSPRNRKEVRCQVCEPHSTRSLEKMPPAATIWSNTSKIMGRRESVVPTGQVRTIYGPKLSERMSERRVTLGGPVEKLKLRPLSRIFPTLETMPLDTLPVE